MEMGTGKTFVSIALLIKYYLDSKKDNFKVLIVGLKDAITSWIIEVKKVFRIIEEGLYAIVKNDEVPVNIFKVGGNVNKRVSNLKMNKMEQVIGSIIESGQSEKVVIFA